MKESKLAQYIIYLVVLALITLVSVALMVFFGVSELSPMWIVTVSIDMFSMFICDILMVSCVMENSGDELNLYFVQVIAFLCMNLFLDMCCWLFDGHAALRQLVFYSNTFYYLMNVLIPVLFMEYIFSELNITGKKKLRVKIVYILSLIAVVELAVNIAYPYLFEVNEAGVYSRKPFFMLNFLSDYVIMLIIIITAMQYSKSFTNKLVIFSYLVFPFVGQAIQINVYGLSITMPCLLLSMILIYTQVHLHRKQKIAEQETVLSQQSVALMVSQMQPHFLYNVLTTISNLCRVNPEEAEEVTVSFSRYLRANLDAMRKVEPVPFEAEMRHIRIYLDLEKKRFGDRLNYEFDIRENNFLVPALAIQPIVENSVKHGICDKGEPGTLKISTYSDDENYFIVIEDDGVGFDPEAPKPDDGRSHVGMQNTKNRLEKICNAKVQVISSIGNGCKTIITIPKKR